MDLAALMTEVSTRLKTIIPRTEIGFAGKVNPPAAVIYPPERITFDLTYGRGSDEMDDLVVVVFVSRGGGNRAAMAKIAPYLNGAGAQSIKAVLDSATTPYVQCQDLQVQWAELDAGARIGSIDLLAALFHCKIRGSGS